MLHSLCFRLPKPPFTGAKSVVACDLHESLCDVARKTAAANGLSGRVSVVHRDAGLLQRGREIRALGVNVVVADLFDAGERWEEEREATGGCAVLSAGPLITLPPRLTLPQLYLAAGLLGDGFPYLLELCRRRVVAPGAAVVPAGATLYCMGVEVATGAVGGFDLSGMNTYR